MKKHIWLIAVALIALVLISFATKDNTTDKKITVCHIPPGNPANAHDIVISVNALQTHLNHGDIIGGCNDGDY